MMDKPLNEQTNERLGWVAGVAGAASATIAHGILQPFDTVKTRMIASHDKATLKNDYQIKYM